MPTPIARVLQTADRFDQSILTLFHIGTASEAQGAQQGTSLSAAGLECTEKILSLLPHPLPHLLADSIQPCRDNSDFRHRDFVGQNIQEFLKKKEHLAAILLGVNHPLLNEAINWFWGLVMALEQDTEGSPESLNPVPRPSLATLASEYPP
jgi:hypothetical protein